MSVPRINSEHGSDTRNVINRAIDVLNQLGFRMQDIVAKGQLTPDQYTQLIQSVNGLIAKGELSVHDIDLNKGKITESMIAESLLKIISGNAPIHSVPEYKSITIDKIAFNRESSNKYNPETTINAILEYSNGTTSPHATLRTSDFIRVDGANSATFAKARTIVFYDSNKKFHSYDPNLTPKQDYTTSIPTGAVYMRFVYQVADFSGRIQQVNLGSKLLDFEPYYNYIPQKYVERQAVINSDITEKSVSADKTNFIQQGKNLANPTNYAVGVYIDPANGNFITSASFDTTDYIRIGNLDKFVVNTFARFYAYARADGTHISGGSNIDAGTVFNPPPNAEFIRLSVYSGGVPNIQVEKGTSVTPFEPFGYIIPNLINTVSSSSLESDHYGKWNMKNFRDQASKYENPIFDERIEVAIIGDSWVAGSRRVTEPLRSKLIKDYGNAGIGFVGFSANRRSTARTEVTTTGTWSEVNKERGLDLRQYRSSTPGSTVKVVTFEDSSEVEIHHIKQTGSYRYRINGGSWKTVNTSTETFVKDSGFTQSNVTLEIEVLTGTVTLLNAYMFNGSRGTVVHQLGYSGGSTADFIEVNRAHYISELKKSNIKSIGILLGTNDMSQSIGLQTFKENLSELIDRIKTANPLIDVFLISPSGNNLTRPLTMKDYDEALYELAVKENVSYVSLYKNMGTYEEQNERGLFEDDVHPNANGGFQIANVIYDRLMRF